MLVGYILSTTDDVHMYQDKDRDSLLPFGDWNIDYIQSQKRGQKKYTS